MSLVRKHEAILYYQHCSTHPTLLCITSLFLEMIHRLYTSQLQLWKVSIERHTRPEKGFLILRRIKQIKNLILKGIKRAQEKDLLGTTQQLPPMCCTKEQKNHRQRNPRR